MFGGSASAFGSGGASKTTAPSVFGAGTAVSSTSSVFGGAVSSTTASVFGGSSAATSKSSVFSRLGAAPSSAPSSTADTLGCASYLSDYCDYSGR